MYYKNYILLLLIKEYEERINGNAVGKEIELKAAKGAIAWCLKIVCEKSWDKEWYDEISQSFYSAIENTVNREDWLADEFAKLGIFQLSDPFQWNIPDDHCMSYVFDFFNRIERRSYFCNLYSSFHHRAEEYLEKYAAPNSISEEKLTPGDLILSKAGVKYTHIAIFIGNIHGKSYAMSKLGYRRKVFLHPVDFRTMESEFSVYFQTNSSFSDETHAQLEAIKAELCARLLSIPFIKDVSFFFARKIKSMKDAGLKLPSGSQRFWSFDDSSVSEKWDDNAIRSNRVFYP